MMAVFNSRMITYGRDHSEINGNNSVAMSAMGQGVGPFRATPGVNVHRHVMHDGETFELRDALAIGRTVSQNGSRDVDEEYGLSTTKWIIIYDFYVGVLVNQIFLMR